MDSIRQFLKMPFASFVNNLIALGVVTINNYVGIKESCIIFCIESIIYQSQSVKFAFSDEINKCSISTASIHSTTFIYTINKGNISIYVLHFYGRTEFAEEITLSEVNRSDIL